MSNNKKIIVYASTLIMILIIFVLEIDYGNKKLEKNCVNYTKESNINYIAYLKDNSHYDSTYLQKEFNFVASLIDYFNIDYNYLYSLDEQIDYELNYGIDAELEIYDSENDAKPIEKKKYTLLEKETKKDQSQIIKVDLYNQKINYETYNKIVQEWKKEISPIANLKIIINIEWKGKSKKLNKDLFDTTTTEFNIPISNKTIDIKNPNNINETGKIKGNKKFSIIYVLLLAITLLLFTAVIIYFLSFLVKINKSKSKYDLKINKLLREFDRVISEANGKFVKKTGENYIEIKNFMELMDVHDNVNGPIIHYQNSKDVNVFVIKNGTETYYTTLNRKDFEKED